MTMDDVRRNYAECYIGQYDVVALADGKFDGYGYHWILDYRLHAGNYLGCPDIEYMLIMTDENHGKKQQTLDWNTCHV